MFCIAQEFQFLLALLKIVVVVVAVAVRDFFVALRQLNKIYLVLKMTTIVLNHFMVHCLHSDHKYKLIDSLLRVQY